MTRPISTRVHGLIDYGWAAAASALSTRVNGATSTARLLQTAATASSLVTNYEAGAVRVMPMKGHLALDFALCGALLAAPGFLPRAERRYAAWPVLFGAAGLIVGMLTKTRSPLESEEFGGMYTRGRELSTTNDQEPDVADSRHLRAHPE